MNVRKQGPFILLVLALAVTCGCGGGGGSTGYTEPPGRGDPITSRDQARERGVWTVLVYLDADNDLETAGVANFNQMEMVGSSKDVRIVVQMDRVRGRDTSDDDWSDTRRYLITRDTDTSTMRSIRLDDQPLGELDMADWRTLRDFVEWGVREFPAEHYCLVVWDHGTGWQVRSQGLMPEHKYIVADDTSYSHMNVTEIPLALSALPVDVIAFDACLMQQLEVAYELKDCAHYMVASPAAEPSPGYDYHTLMAKISGSTSPIQLCQDIVTSYAQTYPAPRKAITQSAVDLTRIGGVATALDAFARVLAANAASAPALTDARQGALNYSTADGGLNRYSLDLLDYADRCAEVIGPTASTALAALRDEVAGTVVVETHNPDTAAARGLAIYVPPPSAYDRLYESLRLAGDTYWDEWLRAQPR